MKPENAKKIEEIKLKAEKFFADFSNPEINGSSLINALTEVFEVEDSNNSSVLNSLSSKENLLLSIEFGMLIEVLLKERKIATVFEWIRIYAYCHFLKGFEFGLCEDMMRREE